MATDRIDVTAAKSVQAQVQNDQLKFAQPDSVDTDKGGNILAQPAKGTKKQLVGTIVGIIALIAFFVLLKTLQVI